MKSLPVDPVLDVAVGIVLEHGRLLVCQRKHSNATLPGLWEFPGGKVEPGESIEACLRRELAEELAIHVEPIARFTERCHRYPKALIRLHPFVCRRIGGEVHAHACERFQWVAPGALLKLEFPPANVEMLHELLDWLATRGDTANP